MVDLRGIAQQDDLGAASHPGDDALDLAGRQVLRLVDHQPGVGDGAAAHEIHGLGCNDAGGEQIVDAAAQLLFGALLLFTVQVQQDLQIVHNGAQERGDLLLLAAGEESDVLVELGIGPADQDLAVGPLLRLQHLLQTGGQGVKSLGRSRRTLGDHQRSLVGAQQQRLLQELLSHAPGLDAEGAGAAVDKGHCPPAVETAQHGLFFRYV